ncbi:type IV pilus modification PilV family protein [Pseudomonas sp.]|uniref:type IV pilus modification PilV family protein n=1 Tax=Pseudomonas sp. TaxID=306 RepID=UPI002C8E2AF8|nr:prepilin-type N-terminal cleavage/methylation domain-containing protein [Pseudomonas sp.]HUE92923.1 prepilin-type N-terminal cleavage/methylation domain-containing protein [Pseudomonas sp.]
MSTPLRFQGQRGLTLIELMVTVIILAVGLLGMAGLQSRLQQSEMEAYQRSQALLLLSDMANRLATNRAKAITYETSLVGIGVGSTCETGTATQQQVDAGEWCNALQGAAEMDEDGNELGAMIGGRGCVEVLGAGSYRVSVAWQGLAPLSVPTNSACGSGQYNGPSGSTCTADLCRRVVSTIVRVADLK